MTTGDRTERQRELDELRERQADDLCILEVDTGRLAIDAPMPPASRTHREILELQLRRTADTFRTELIADAIAAAAPDVAERFARHYIAATKYKHDRNFGDPGSRAEQRLESGYAPPLDPSAKNDLQTYAFLVALADHVAGVDESGSVT